MQVPAFPQKQCHAWPLTAAGHVQAGGQWHGLSGIYQPNSSRPRLPQHPRAIGDDRKDRRLWYVPKSILTGLLSCVWRSLRPCPLDAPRGRDLREIHHEGGRVVVRSSSLGDLQLCHAAILGLTERRCSRNDPTWQAAGEARSLPGQGVLAGPG